MNIKLTPQVTHTKDGLFKVTYKRMAAPLDVQEASFARVLPNALQTVSPAVLGYLRTQCPGVDDIAAYSRTDMDVFYDLRIRTAPEAVLVRDSAISRLFLSDLVQSHREGREFVIPENIQELVYAVIDLMKQQGTAMKVPFGTTSDSTSEFGNREIPNFMYTDDRLGIKAEDYGAFMDSLGVKVHNLSLDVKDYASSQKGSYLNRLGVCDYYYDFGAIGYWSLKFDFGALGVFLERANKDRASQG